MLLRVMGDLCCCRRGGKARQWHACICPPLSRARDGTGSIKCHLVSPNKAQRSGRERKEGRKAVRLLRARSNAVCQLAIASLSLSLCYRSYSSHDLISSQPVTIIGHVLDFSSSGQATRTGGGRWRNFWCSVGQIIIWATGLCSCASPACRLQVRSIVLYIDWIGRD
jgi:hypothetical protein